MAPASPSPQADAAPGAQAGNGPAAAEPASPRTVRFPLEFADLVVGGALLAAAAWFHVAAGRIEEMPGDPIGPDGFPKALSFTLGALALALLLGAAWRLATGRSLAPVTIGRPGPVIIGMGLIVAFPVAMRHLGYYPAMALWLGAFLWVAGGTRPARIALYVAGFLLFTKLVFELTLKTPLP